MKKFVKKFCILSISLLMIVICIYFYVEFNDVKAASLESEDYYKLLATAIDVSDTNTFEDNKNQQIFDSSNDIFINAVSARRDVDTYASSIESSSAYEFSQKYSKTFSTSLDTSVSVAGVTTDISGKFDTNVNTESWKQQIESYEYYYWFAQKYVVNIDWKAEDISEALSVSFERELNNVDSVFSAKTLLREYGTHVYSTYILGGKLEITKYFTQDAVYELSETEKSVSASLNVIVDSAKADAKVSGSVNLSTFETNSTSNKSIYSKLSYHAYGGNTNSAATVSDLFQYKTQFGTGTASGFLYEAWTNSFNEDGVPLKIVSADKAVAIWDILDNSKYSKQIDLLKRAFENMCYESYAEKCSDLGIACEYIEALSYSSKGTNVLITPYMSNIYLPENTTVNIKMSELITSELDIDNYELKLDYSKFATLTNDILIINKNTTGQKFKIQLFIDGISIYELNVTIKKESYSGGYGTKQQPYLLGTKGDLLTAIGDFSDSNYYYQLISDIDLKGEKIDVGGSGNSSSFDGVFDGDGYSIKNGTVKASSFKDGFANVGLFGSNKGIIKNLTLNNVVCLTNGLLSINNDVSVAAGILVGFNDGIISNCQVKNSSIRVASTISSSISNVNIGGLAGYSQGLIEFSAIVNCNICGITTEGSGKINVGGIVGKLSGAKITESYVTSTNVQVEKFKKSTFTLGGVVGIMTTKTLEDGTIIKPILSMCIVYETKINKMEGKIGYIAGEENNGEFVHCYYKALMEKSVNGAAMSNCYLKNSLNINALPTAFSENWVDGENGPVLSIHLSNGGNN